MFRKIRTTINGNTAEVTQERQYEVHPERVEADMAEQRRSLRQLAMGYGRISDVTESVTGLVVSYTSGTVVVHQWIAEPE
jgi:two-component SAPR family response regulator